MDVEQRRAARKPPASLKDILNKCLSTRQR